MEFVIRTADIETAVRVSREIPELKAPYGPEEYQKRFAGTPHLIVAAYRGGRAVGFKAGYERGGAFFSWMGGVVPAFRKQGIAKALAEAQERWAKAQGYDSITFKTRNVHKAMLIFALGNGFNITGVEEKPDVNANRIWLKKVF